MYHGCNTQVSALYTLALGLYGGTQHFYVAGESKQRNVSVSMSLSGIVVNGTCSPSMHRSTLMDDMAGWALN